MSIIKRFAQDESGATAIEYGLIAALIALAIVGGASTLGGDLSAKFEEIATALDGGGDGGAGGD